MTNIPMLGELLVKNNLVSQEVVDEALRIQVGGTRRLGHLLVRMKAITDDQLAETLANQLNMPTTKIAETFSDKVNKTIPRYLCKKYGVIPIRFKDNNILEVAMANPSDHEAINDLEHYTGKVLDPCLAKHSEIDREIPKRIPLGLKDFFSPQANTLMTRAVAVLALVCAVGIGFYTYDYLKKMHQGTISVADNLTLYHNHDLTLAVDKNGKFSLQGHGAYADGLYKVDFSNLTNLKMFISQRKADFSGKQYEWLDWALQKAGNNSELLAKN
ncbi:hypothetical protein [Desulfopila sp. IMCC35008]|uniref:GspE/PulE/PilB domain-containing protein n=1 Tax=Desulfopila sp. IMCC35008 TaxID=2653858 RepID=UPI0013D14128|nr:hypothetical protein [Desulfopila sp. IMCC35008]